MCNVLHTPRTAVIIYNWFDAAVNYDCSRLYQNICAAWTARLALSANYFQLSWLSLSYKLVKILSVCVCLDVNKGATNRNRCTQRLACTDLLVNSVSRIKIRSVWPTLPVNITHQKVGVNRHFQASWASQTMRCLLHQKNVIQWKRFLLNCQMWMCKVVWEWMLQWSRRHRSTQFHARVTVTYSGDELA